MQFSLAGFKVIYNERVFRALATDWIDMDGSVPDLGKTEKPKSIALFVLNEDGNIVRICDEAWRFQFIPVIGKEV